MSQANPAYPFLVVNGGSPVSVSGTGTTIKYFPQNSYIPVGQTSSTTAIGYLNAPNQVLNGQQFVVKAGGNFEVGAGGTCPSVLIGLYPVSYSGITPTIGSTAILSYSSTLQNLTGTNYPWALSAKFAGDTGSGLVQQIKGSIVVDGANTNLVAGLVTGLSGINFNNAIPFGFVVGVTFSVSEAGNAASMYQFFMDW